MVAAEKTAAGRFPSQYSVGRFVVVVVYKKKTLGPAARKEDDCIMCLWGWWVGWGLRASRAVLDPGGGEMRAHMYENGERKRVCFLAAKRKQKV